MKNWIKAHPKITAAIGLGAAAAASAYAPGSGPVVRSVLASVCKALGYC